MLSAVIGANFGDEGKGLMTDYLCSRVESPLVVRFNGGAQAGHTVTTPEHRHIFHHIGAGTLAGADTLLSRFFISNPLLFFREWDELVEKRIIEVEKGRIPTVYVEEDSMVTTPYEMLINQVVETRRGSARHGSCGIGINETIERNLRDRPLRVRDLDDPELSDRLITIRDQWVPRRLAELGVESLTDLERERLRSEQLLENTIRDFHDYRRYTRPAAMSMFKDRNIVFEGAQGLLLDEYHRWFPHVTRSRTGLPNVQVLAAEIGGEPVDVYYMTRAYLTRHGAGPMPFETTDKPYEGIVDTTNIPNPWQGSLRFGHLNVDLLHETVMADLRGSRNVRPQIVMTCLDQLDSTVSFAEGNLVHHASVDALCGRVFEPFGGGMISMGPTRSTVLTPTTQAA